MANRSTRCGIRLVLAGGAFGTFAALRALDDTFGGCWPPSLWMLGRGKLPQHVLRVRSCSKLAAALDYNSTAEARGSRLHSTYDTKRTSNHRVPAGEKSEGVHLRQRWRLCDHAPFGRDPGARLEERADVRHGRHAGGGACSHLGRAACAQRPISVQAREGRAGSGSHPWRVPWMLR